MADITFSFDAATVGADYALPVNIVDPVTGTPPDLSTYTGDFQVRQTSGSAIVLEASTANGQMTLGPSQPQILIKFPGSQITVAGTFQGELKLVDSNGVISKPIGGPFQIASTITP